MIRSLYFALFVLLGQSISQPSREPMHCTANPCKITVLPNTTQILVATQASSGTITDSLGGTWIQDFCTRFDNGICQFHAQFNYSYPIGDVLTFPNGFAHIFVLQYAGALTFVIGQQGAYDAQNAPFPDCTNGQDCPYDWTLPVEPDAGNLLIAYSFANSTGPGLPTPGFGYNIEASDGFLAIEDMIAPIGGVPYIGSLTWRMPDGTPSGGSHWVMGIGVYARSH